MGGADGSQTGLTYSQRISNSGPGRTPQVVREDMLGHGRIEGTAVVLPDGTVILNSGAALGETCLTVPAAEGACWHEAHSRCAAVSACTVTGPKLKGACVLCAMLKARRGA